MKFLKQAVAGFSMIEVLVTTTIVGLLSAITVPSWFQFINILRLNEAQDRVFAVMRDAQANAKREYATWQVCFRDDGTQVWVAEQLVSSSTTNCSNSGINWQPVVGSDSKFVTINTTSTNLSSQTTSSVVYYELQYTSKGWIDTGVNTPFQIQKITLSMRNQTKSSQRCIFVETSLGALRTDNDANCQNSQ